MDSLVHDPSLGWGSKCRARHHARAPAVRRRGNSVGMADDNKVQRQWSRGGWTCWQRQRLERRLEVDGSMTGFLAIGGNVGLVDGRKSLATAR